MGCANIKKLKGDKLGVVLGSFAPMHKGHLDLIMRAKKENEGCIVVVCGFKGDKGGTMLPLDKKFRYVRELFKDDDLVSVVYISDDELGIAGRNDQWDIWLREFFRVEDFINSKAELVWYIGEKEYKEALEVRGEKAILVDRSLNLISATMIRNNPLKYWNDIAPTYRRTFSHNILILGTASEGKTTLVQDIGKYFNLPFGREYARDYMLERNLNEEELSAIDYMNFLLGQYNLNRDLIESNENNGIFVADTDALTTRMYIRYYCKDESLNISEEERDRLLLFSEEMVRNARWNKIFLFPPKGKFVDDGVRYMEHSSMDIREDMFNMLLEDIIHFDLWDKVTILGGTYLNNYLQVKNYIDGVINNGKN